MVSTITEFLSPVLRTLGPGKAPVLSVVDAENSQWAAHPLSWLFGAQGGALWSVAVRMCGVVRSTFWPSWGLRDEHHSEVL